MESCTLTCPGSSITHPLFLDAVPTPSANSGRVVKVSCDTYHKRQLCSERNYRKCLADTQFTLPRHFRSTA